MHNIRKSLIYSTKKAFLEKTVVELVYKFDKSCHEYRKYKRRTGSISEIKYLTANAETAEAMV